MEEKQKKSKKGKKVLEEEQMPEDTIDYDEAETVGQDKIKKIKRELDICKKERQEYLSGWQRARADIINQRRESEEKVNRIGDFAREEIITRLFSVLDSFDMAFSNKEAWEKVDTNWRSGVEHIHSNLISVLSDYNITPFDPTGELFDPTEHEPLESIPTDNKKEEGLIVEVLQKGYRRDKIVVRPAKVKVATYKLE